MLQRSRELILSLVAIVFITVTYLLVEFIFQASPDPGSFFGHALGVLGFLLMIMTEILYTLRKRSRSARWGKMSEWLEFHIFTGLVGPYMVLLHSAWHFNGLAGALTLMTIVIVISGFIGRYIYTAIPRTPNGVEVTLAELEDQAAQVESELATILAPPPPLSHPQAAYSTEIGSAAQPAPGNFRAQVQRGEPLRNLGEEGRIKTSQLAALPKKRQRILREINSLDYARRMLAIWHLVHIPLGLTLFVMGFIHVFAAIYYAVLMK